MKRCRLKRLNFQIKTKMSKENKPLGKHEYGNDSFTISPKEWNLFQWCYAYVLWALIWCGLINLLVWAFS